MYEEAAPPERLRGVARCVWRSASAAPKRIVPDGCLDLVVGEGGAFIAGPDTTAWSSVTRPGEVLHGVRFTPGRAAAVLGVAADELRDSRVPLGELWGHEGELLAERLVSGALTPAAAVAARLAEVAPADPAVAALIAQLDAGAARVSEALNRPDAGPAQVAEAAAALAKPSAGAGGALVAQGAVGERRLRRRFVQAVGYGPATYLRVSRFQRAVALAPRVPGLAELAAVAGYSDQAHLSRDCRALTGLTPRAYFRGPSTVERQVRSA
jgi:AraC-like DNA-binding protein